MAPFYFGLVVSLAVLLFEILHGAVGIHRPRAGLKESDIILGVLGLIDISLTGNLILIVVFSGYENFVSKIDPGSHPDWPDWMTKVNFGGLKQKLLASIVAISAIQVLKAFMNIDTVFDPSKLAWLVGVHLVFVFRGHAGDVRPLERRRPWRRVACAIRLFAALFPHAAKFLGFRIEHEQRALGDAEIGAVQIHLALFDAVRARTETSSGSRGCGTPRPFRSGW